MNVAELMGIQIEHKILKVSKKIHEQNAHFTRTFFAKFHSLRRKI